MVALLLWSVSNNDRCFADLSRCTEEVNPMSIELKDRNSELETLVNDAADQLHAQYDDEERIHIPNIKDGEKTEPAPEVLVQPPETIEQQTEELTPKEHDTFATCEKVIARFVDSLAEVSKALRMIRDRRLYRAEYATFENYCLERWHYHRRRVYQLIDAGQVLENVHNCARIEPQNEAQVRQLARLQTPDQQIQIWRQVIEQHGERVTAHAIKLLVNKIARVSAPETDTFPQFEVAITITITNSVRAANQDRAIAAIREHIYKRLKERHCSNEHITVSALTTEAQS